MLAQSQMVLNISALLIALTIPHDEEICFLNNLETVVADYDELIILPAAAGGQDE